MKKLCVVGLGYIGLPTAAVFANNGWKVHGVDANPEVVQAINSGKIHIEEIGLEALVKKTVVNKRLKASDKVSAADCFIIAVPTPMNNKKKANLNYVISACKDIIKVVKQNDIIIVESTIPPRTIEDIVAPIFENEGWKVGEDIYLAHCPERVLPGRIIIEVIENNRIVGGINKESTKRAAEVYNTFVTGEILETSSLSAEMSKLMENTYRDVNIALANELVKISEKLNVNALEVIELANKHPRVNIHLPGPGVGGHCLAVDPYFIIEKSSDNSKLIKTAREINNSMPDFVVSEVEKRLSIQDTKLTVLGLTYKGDVDDIRESPAIEIVNKLLEKGYNLAAYDPFVEQSSVSFQLKNFESAIENSDCILILTDHSAFTTLNETKIIETMKTPLIIDTKNCVKIKSRDIEYINFGNLGKNKLKQV